MRFWKKKYYREVPCKVCDGTGKIKSIGNGGEGPAIIMAQLIQGICFACNGKGSQTVLEREE